MNALILLPDRNHHGGDWQGAFRPEALAFQRCHGLPDSSVVQMDISHNELHRRAQVIEAIQNAAAHTPLDLVVMLCHGEKTWLQLGFGPSTIPALAEALAMAGRPDLRVMLYACSAAGGDGPAGDGGLADLLRDCLCACLSRDGQAIDQCQVDGHTVAGHTTSNPYVRRMCGPAHPEGGQDGHGGAYLVEPKSPLWDRWSAALRDRHHNTLRLRFCLMSRQQIEAELEGA